MCNWVCYCENDGVYLKMEIKKPIKIFKPVDTETENKSLMSSFSQQKNKNEMNDIMSELFNIEKIRMITDLSDSEIKLVTRLEILSDIKSIDVYKKGIQVFLELKLSKRRLSRTEILKAVEGYYSTIKAESQNIKKTMLI